MFDGIQEETELFRFGMSVLWGRTTDYYHTRLSFGRVEAGFAGRVRAIHEGDPDFGADCRSHRTIGIRRRVDGRDPTLGSAASNERGVWISRWGLVPPTTAASSCPSGAVRAMARATAAEERSG